MKIYTSILGDIKDDKYQDHIHRCEHDQTLDLIEIKNTDVARRKFKAVSVKGYNVGIALPRNEKLCDGAILEYGNRYSLVLRTQPEDWIQIQPKNKGVALRLGYFAGNLHWTVKFEKDILWVAQTQELQTYISRINQAFSADEAQILNTVLKSRKSKL